MAKTITPTALNSKGYIKSVLQWTLVTMLRHQMFLSLAEFPEFAVWKVLRLPMYTFRQRGRQAAPLAVLLIY